MDVSAVACSASANRFEPRRLNQPNKIGKAYVPRVVARSFEELLYTRHCTSLSPRRFPLGRPTFLRTTTEVKPALVSPENIDVPA